MNASRAKAIALHPLLWAAVGGLCLTLSFPKFNVAGLAWIAPALILLAAQREPRHAFRTGYVAGLVFHLTALCWLLNIPVTGAPILGWFALGAYAALFTGAWAWVCCQLRPNCEELISGSSQAEKRLNDIRAHRPTLASLGGVGGGFFRGASAGHGRMHRTLWALQCAAIWVALEMIQARLFTGFPWNQLGTSQWRQIPLIQLASVTGVYGVSFLIVWCSVAFLGAAMVFRRDPSSRAWRIDLLAPVIAVVLVVTFGLAKIFHAERSERFLKVALVQPSIPQTLIWNPAESTNRFQKILRLSELALASKPDVLIWPEAAVPNLLRYDKETFDAVTGLAKKHGVWMIVGADDAEPRRGDPSGKDADYFNSAFLISPAGELAAKYDKQRLVIFGEYIPLVRWLPFLKWFTPITSGFAQGRGPVPFAAPGPRFKTSVMICFEDMFAALARTYAEPDTDFLLNLTNDGWFGEGAEQWQHAAAAVFRAVENGLPVVRCTNNGLTCWIDRFGVLHDAGVGDGDIYGEGFRTMKIPLLPEGAPRAPTFYNQRGDWFGWVCVAFGMLLPTRVWLERKSARE
ncbi:MAG TPA: apolipoprotein N-acyltransferase [Verrucomicrobiae bacterium]